MDGSGRRSQISFEDFLRAMLSAGWLFMVLEPRIECCHAGSLSTTR
jgi:hypothetical protein